MNNFRTKIDGSNNRQFKHQEKTDLNLSGVTYFGLKYEDLTFGADPTSSGITETYFNLSGSFSGNYSTTNYSLPDARMSIATGQLPIITTSLTGITFNTGNVFVGYNSNIIDSETYYQDYSGVQYTIIIDNVSELTPSAFTGTISISELNILSADTLDWNSRRIWSITNGITQTDDLIIKSGATDGDVLYVKNSNGDIGGYPLSGLTGSSAGDQFWVSGSATNSVTLSGRGNTMSGVSSVAISENGFTYGNYSHAEGFQTTASGDYSHAEGMLTKSYSLGSHAEGYENYAFGGYSHVEGAYTTTLGLASHSEGSYALTIGAYSHAEGYGTIASAAFSHSEGATTTSNGNYSHAEGLSTATIGDYSHSEGYLTISTALYSHAEGDSTTSIGIGSHSEGKLTISNGGYSHAEGYFTNSKGHYSHAEGGFTNSSAPYSHAEGYSSLSNGNFSHAEGYATTSTGEYSHSEGFQTKSFGYASHSEGLLSVASGDYSHAEGRSTTSIGEFSHAQGHLNITSANYSLIAGGYNVINSGSTYSSIIGSSGSTIQSNVTNSAIIGSKDRTASNSNTTYTSNLDVDATYNQYVIGDVSLSSQTLTVEVDRDVNFQLSASTIYKTLTNVNVGQSLLTLSTTTGINIFEGYVIMKSTSGTYDFIDDFYLVVKNGTVGFLGTVDENVKSNFVDTTDISFTFNGTNLDINFTYGRTACDVILKIKRINNNM